MGYRSVGVAQQVVLLNKLIIGFDDKSCSLVLLQLDVGGHVACDDFTCHQNGDQGSGDRGRGCVGGFLGKNGSTDHCGPDGDWVYCCESGDRVALDFGCAIVGGVAAGCGFASESEQQGDE